MLWGKSAQRAAATKVFKDKVVAITGAGSGIGRSLALKFAETGARLAISDINAQSLAETVALLPAGTQVRKYVVDVTIPEEVSNYALQVKQDFGTAHAIINNAGAIVAGTVEHTSIDEYRWQLDLNLYGVLYGTKAFLPIFLNQQEGWIVNVSSPFGLFGFPAHSAYSMSKFAIRGLTECLWSELEDTGVKAICVHPGSIKTGIDKSTRLARQAGAVERQLIETLNKRMTASPDDCAAEILRGMCQGKRRILAGKGAAAAHWMTRLVPNSYPALLKWV